MMIRNNIFKILIAFWFVFLTWFLLFSYGHCADLEYYFPMQQNENRTISDTDIYGLNNYFDFENYNVFIRYAQTFSTGNAYYFVYCPKSDSSGIFGEIQGNLYQFSLYSVGSPTLTNGRVIITPSGEVFNPIIYNQNAFTNFRNLDSSVYNSSVSYLSNFQVYTNNSESAKIVLLYDDGITVPEGETARDDMEKPESEDYFPNWTTQPNFDNSSVENALNSVFSIIGWLGNNIKDSITGLGNFITDTVRWSIQKVLDRITDTANALLSGIQSKINDVISTIGGKIDIFSGKLSDLYNGFTDFADLFIHPFDEEEYEEQIANCELISQYDQLIENCEDIQEIFDYAEERDHFSLYIDFENPFADAQHKIITSEISFDWLVPLRSVYRPFLWVFTLIELFTGSMRLLGNIIGGKAK